MSNTAQAIYDNYVASVKEGAFDHLDAPPVVPIEATAAKSPPRRGSCSSPRHRIDEPWYDKDRGYKPGEMTTKDWVVAIIEILQDAPNAKLGQSVLVDRAHGLIGISRGRTAMRVSASLYWLRVVGLVHECEKRSPAPKKQATVHWQLTKMVP